MEVKDLTPNPRNPRRITDEKLVALKRALTEFGDLGGFVYNRKTKRLVGGHQRAKVFNAHSKIVFEKTYTKPTKTGTVAEGYVVFGGERFKYREVSWDDVREKAANVAANKGAGEWDEPMLAEWLRDIGDFGFDPDLTLFDGDERADLLASLEPAKKKEPKADSDDQPKEKKRVTCPECDHKFVPGWS